MTDELRIAGRAIGANYVASALILGAQVVYTAVTARLISPVGFGAYAVAQALAILVSYFGLATLGSALIRHERHDRIVTGTALVLSLLSGVGAALVMLVAVGPWMQLWDAPEAAAEAARLFSLVALLTALSVVPIALLRRQLRYGRAAAIEAGGAIAGMVAGIVLAAELRSPAALVIGQAIGLTLIAGVAATTVRRELTVAFSRSEARGLLSFAGHVTGQNVLYYGIYAAPALVISRVFGAATLGAYSRANALVTLPTTHLWMGVTKALYPLIARARNDRRRLRELVETTVLSTTGLLWPLFAAVAGSAPLVIDVLLGSEFSLATDMLAPLLVFGAVNLAYVVAGNPLEVLGFKRIIWTYQLLWAVLLGTVLGLGIASDWPLVSILWGVAAAQVVIHAVKLTVTARLGLLGLGRVLSGYALTLAVSALFYGVLAATEAVLHGEALVVRSLLQITVAGALTVLFLRLPGSPMSRAIQALRGTARAARSSTGSKPVAVPGADGQLGAIPS